MAKLHRDNAGYIGCSHEETQDPYYSYNKLSLPLSGATETVQRPAEVTHTVTVAGGKFVIGGVSQATLSLVEGGIYTFDLSDVSVTTHPFRIRKAVNTVANSLTNGLPSGYSATTASQYTGTVSNIETDDTNSLYATNNHIDFDLGAAKTIHSFKAIFHSNDNSSSYATYRIELYSDSSFSNLIAASDSVISTNLSDIQTLNYDFGGVEARYVRWSYQGGGRTMYLRYFYPYADTPDVVLTTSGTQGQSGATAKYVVPFGTLGSYEYYCASHAGMGAIISVSANAGMFTGALPILKTTDQFGASAPTGGSAVNVVGDPTSSTDNPFGSGNGHSVEFDGNDALRINGGSLGTGNFTIEYWVYGSSFAGIQRHVSGREMTYSSEFTNLRSNGGAYDLTVGDSPGHQYINTGTIPTNQWVHIAVCRNGTGVHYFANGSRLDTDTIGSSVNTTLTEVNVAHGYGSEYFTGKISNVRVSNTYRYSGSTYTIPTAGFTSDANTLLLAAHTSSITTAQGTWSSGVWPGTEDTAPDPYAANLVLALPMNGSNNGTTFTDQSATIKGSGSAKAITRTGNTKTVTTTSNYYGSSGYFDGVNDSLITPDSSDFDFGTGDFTIEQWVYQTEQTSNQYYVVNAQYVSGQSDNSWWWAIHGNYSRFFYYSATASGSIGSSSTTVPINTWTHLAVTRQNGTLRLLQNGVVTHSLLWPDSMYNSPAHVTIGADYDVNYDFKGYISDARIYKGVAKYTSNFSVVDMLSLTDLSSSAHTVTNNGASFQTSVKKFYGGAAEFDSSYLTIPATSDFNFSGGDFTMECWFNQQTNASMALTDFVGQSSGSAPSGQWYYSTSNGLGWYHASTTYAAAGQPWNLNSWVHAALVRNGNTLTTYINGSQSGSSAFTRSDAGTSTLDLRIGLQGATYWDGFIQDFRIYKGIAKYTSSFSPPERSIQGTARRYPSGVYVVS